MGEFLVFLAGLPSIALSAIFGALFGLVGGLLGVILKRWGFTNAWRYAAGIAVAVSVPLTSNLIKPAIQDAALNDGLPKSLMISPSTRRRKSYLVVSSTASDWWVPSRQTSKFPRLSKRTCKGFARFGSRI